ncbi:MAG: extracellular solute-binding protein [Planctomycetota bacterium]
MRLFSRSVSWLWLGVLLVAICPAQAQNPERGGDTTNLRVERIPDPERTDVPAQAMRETIRAFVERNPDVAVEPFTMPKVGPSAMDSGPLMAIAAGVPPHVIYVNFRQTSTYIGQGFLAPMEVLLARVLADDPKLREHDGQRFLHEPTPIQIDAAREAIRQRVPENAWPVVYRDDESGMVFDEQGNPPKHVWSVPYGPVVIAMLYRRDLFNQVGLDPDAPPETWDELLDAARRLTVPERNQYGIAVSSLLSYSTYGFLVSQGGRAVEQAEDGTWRAAYDSQEAAEAYSYVWELLRGPFERDGETIPGAGYIGGGEIPLMFNQGRIGMRFEYLTEELLGDLNPQLYGIAPLPKSWAGTRGSEINAMMYGVFAGATPVEQLAATRFIWFITSDEAKEIRTRVMVDQGFGEFVAPALLRKFGYDRILERVPAGWQEAYDTAIANGVPEPYGQNTQNIYIHMNLPVSQAMDLDLSDVPQEQRVAMIRELLAESVADVDRRVLGNISDEERANRRFWAWVVMIGVAAAFLLGFGHVWRFFTKLDKANAPPKPQHGKRFRFSWGWALIMPAMVLMLAWQYAPLLGGAVMALSDYRIVQESMFVGVDNFADVLFDERFWNALGRTFYFVALMIVLGFWPPILLAILLDEVPTNFLKYVFRTVYYLPAVISGVIIMFLWKQLYEPSAFGILNQLVLSLNGLPGWAATSVKLSVASLWVTLFVTLVALPIKLDEMTKPLKLGLWAVAGVVAWGGLSALLSQGFSVLAGSYTLEPLRFIASPDSAMFWTVIPIVWATMGPGCLLYLAALKTVPSDLYEAAAIDGAGVWARVFYITLPRLKFLIVIQFIAAVVAAFKGGVDFILAMTQGGPQDATTVLALEVFNRAFLDLRFGIGAAMAWILGAILIGFTAYQLKMLSRAEFAGGRK